MKGHIKHARNMQESQMTAEEALQWAWQYYDDHGQKWPTRRWRVVTSALGNSRLLGKRAAERTRSKHGGELVELVPLRKYAGARP